MQARHARIVDHEIGFGNATDLQWQIGQVEGVAHVEPAQLDPAVQRLRGLVQRVQITRQGQELRKHFALPFHPENFTGFDAALDPHGPQAAAAHTRTRPQVANNAVVGQDLLRSGQIAEARGHVDRIAKTIPIHLNHLPPGHADLHQQLEAVGPAGHALCVLLLYLTHAVHRQPVVLER